MSGHRNHFLCTKFLWHWFSVMGTVLPFDIVTYAICIWKISCTDSRLSRIPKATAGTSRVVKWTRSKLCTTQYTRHSLCNPVVALAYILVLRRQVAHFRRRALKNASACLAWIAVSAMERAVAGCSGPGLCY